MASTGTRPAGGGVELVVVLAAIHESTDARSVGKLDRIARLPTGPHHPWKTDTPRCRWLPSRLRCRHGAGRLFGDRSRAAAPGARRVRLRKAASEIRRARAMSRSILRAAGLCAASALTFALFAQDKADKPAK